jgi:hypothetical protein
MPYVEHLERSGVLRGLDPLTRPLRLADVRRSLAEVDTTSLPSAVASLVRVLAQQLEAPATDTVHWRLEASVAAHGFSDPQRLPLRADSGGNAARLVPEAGLAASLEMPHLVMVTRPRVDNRLKYDRDYTGKKDRIVAGRNDEAYVAASWRYAEVFFGIVDRNWGPSDLHGLLLSPNPYAYDHLLVRLGPRRLRLELLATQLDALPLWDATQPVNRYLSAHRLVAAPSERLALSLGEAAVYAQSGGVSRSFEPWYLNPLNLFLLAQYNDAPTSNALFTAEAAWRAGASLRLYGQVLIDDIQVDRTTQGDREPSGYGLTLGGSGGAAGGVVSWSAFYTRVSNLAYRTPAREEQYTLRGQGLARGYDDYDQLTARAGAATSRALLLGAELTLLRQGEGRIERRYPAESLFADSLAFLTGTVERTVRAGVEAAWAPVSGLSLTANLARHLVSNSRHVSGADLGRWVWRLRIEARRRLAGTLPW